jgi:hypothetical protein
MKTFDSIVYIFDKMEDHIRARLARHPFIYAFIGGAGVVLFWRGVWHIADVFEKTSQIGAHIFSPLGSLVLGIVVLLSVGLFVSAFIGDSIIMSGIRHDKKIIEKTIEDVEAEKSDLDKMLIAVNSMQQELAHLEGKLKVRCEG